MQTRDEFVKLLTWLPNASWTRVMSSEPAWREMEEFLPAFGFGPFATTLVLAGLNSVQLKGSADRVYWLSLRDRLSTVPVPASPSDLATVLKPFYEQERSAGMKAHRLRQFLSSQLAVDLWRSTPGQVAKEYGQLWQRLARVMNQRMELKTTASAMRCLGLALVMAGMHDFESELLLLPNDLRVRRLTEALGQSTASDEVVRKYWAEILTDVRTTNPRVTMIHLDSFVWQVADDVSEPAVRAYCRSMQMGEIGDAIASLIGRGRHDR